jgi:phosphatidylglycerophosphate synthase
MVHGKLVMQPVLRGPALGLAAQALLLCLLAAAVGLNAAGWIVGAACGLVVDAGLARGLRRDPAQLGPATWVTLTRATLAVGVAAMTAASFDGGTSAAVLVSLSAVALVLDYADGQVARRTGTESALGGRLDGEVDAFLILVLSVYAAPSYGWWVLLIGAARYLFFAAGWGCEWMRATLPRRDWRKTVTAVQGITLTIAAAGVVPVRVMQAALAVALALLAESFGRDVWWLWRHRREHAGAAAAVAPTRHGPLRAGVSAVLTVLAVLVVWVALVAPNQPSLVTPDAFARLPIEGVVVIALAVMLPDRGRRLLALLAGAVLSLLLLVKILDVGFITAFDRPFNPVDDWSYAPIGVETLRDSIGRTKANVVLGGAALVAVLVLVLPTASMLRLSRVAAGHRRLSLQAVGSLAIAWGMCWALGAQLVSSAPIASTSAAELAVQEVRTVQAGIRDRARFAQEIRRDRYQYTPGDRLLTALRGKDVLLLIVESYGQVAVQGSSFSPGVDGVLARGDRQLAAAGFSARSGWLTSPTFGGISWLAHSTLQSGVWVNSPTRYDTLMGSHRFTLNQAFSRAGWRTVDDVPSDDRFWSDGADFYHFDKVYNRNTVGYRGPTYAYASMPDQYVYAALQRLELGRRDRPPLFAEVDLVSSHEPWTQIPPLIGWDRVGDGSVYYHLPVDMIGNTDVKQAYGRSVQYTLRTLFSFVGRYARKNLVMIVLGDHQPAKIVSGESPTHEVPISIIAHDPAVLNSIGRWGWSPGMQPARSAPVWPMSAFRNRFLAAFGSTP